MPISAIMAGVNVTHFIQVDAALQIVLNLENRGSATFRLFDSAQAFVPVAGMPVAIYNLDGTIEFVGDVFDITKKRKALATAGTLMYDCQCVSLENRLDKRYVYGKSWIAINPATIVAELMTDWAAGEAITAGTIAPPTLLAVNGHAADSTLRLYVLAAYPNYIQNGTMLRLYSFGTSPGGVTCDGTVVYFVQARTSTTIQIALTPFGTPVTITSDGTPGIVAVPVIDLVIDKPTPVTDVLTTLARLTNSIWWVDTANLLQFVGRSANSAPFTITDSNTNFDDLTVRTTSVQYFNREYRQVSFAGFAKLIETFHGDGTVRKWTLSDEAVLIESIMLNGADSKLGQYLVDAAGTNDFYWRRGSADFIQDPAAAVLTSSDAIVVTYRPLGGDVVIAEDTAQIAARQVVETDSSGIHGTFVDDSSNADAKGSLVTAQADVTAFALIPEVITVTTRKPGLKPGQLLTIHRASMGLASAYLLDRVTATAVPFQQPGQSATDYQFFRYDAQTIDGTKLLNYIDYFKKLAGRGGRASVVAASAGGGGGSVSGAYQLQTLS